MKTMKFLTVAILAILFFGSCSKDDSVDQPEPQQQLPEPPQNGLPTDFIYTNSQIDVDFYSTGSLSSPSVNWNGEAGTYSLSDTYPGVTINNTTGVISYNKTLPLGETIVRVKAENSYGAANSEVVLNHNFEGNFAGGWNHDPTSTILTDFGLLMNFNVDGTMTITINGATGTGSWYLIPNGGNGQIKVTFTISGSPTAYQFFGDVTYNEAIPPIMDGPFRLAGANYNEGIMHLEII